MRKPRKFTVPPREEQNEVVWPDPDTATSADLRAAYELFYNPAARDDLVWASHSQPGGGAHGPDFGEHRAKIIRRGIQQEKQSRQYPATVVLH